MLADFKPLEANARLHLGQLVTLDVALQPGSAADRQVSADAGVASEMSAVASTHITSDFLSSTPIAERFGQDALRLAPGVNPQNDSAYGSLGAWSNAYRLGDLDSSDPENGRAWVFPALNWIEEVRVVSLGAGAEHGGFTGAASDTLLRSGTNVFHGLAESLYRNGSLTATNVPADVVAANPDLSPAQTDIVSDNSVQVGGPLVRDALWFFAGAHFYYARLTPGGYPQRLRRGCVPQPRVRPLRRRVLRACCSGRHGNRPIGAPCPDSCTRSAQSCRVEVRRRASRPKRRSRSTRERSPGTDTTRGCSHHRPSSTPLTRDSTGPKTSNPITA